MSVNRKHPKYLEYLQKYEDLVMRGREETESVSASGGKDGPLAEVHRKYMDKLKHLRQAYSYLFTEDTPDD